ncbi:MAG TPA: ferredoxin reductase [Candidatus Dormibacteraeota bacterium]|nr:ferredoxin reductase [Candidatus Dormibacteraeota bacterium]
MEIRTGGDAWHILGVENAPTESRSIQSVIRKTRKSVRIAPVRASTSSSWLLSYTGMTETRSPAIQAPPILWRQAEVLAIFAETPRVKSLLLRVAGWPGHQPGQYVDVRLTAEDGYQAERSYSLASAPQPDLPQREIVQLTIEYMDEGEVSPYLANPLRLGDRVEIRGPIGDDFIWTATGGEPLVLVAGGTGIVPIMSMLRHRALQQSRPPVWLLDSSRSYDEIVYREELDRLQAAGDGLRIFHTLTRNQPPGWPGFRRRIDRSMLRDVMPPPEAGSIAYVCGPAEMVETVATALVDLGYDRRRVKTERFGPTGP